MAKSKIKWNVAGFKQLRSEPGVVDRLDEEAERVASLAGPGYEVGSQQGQSRPQGRWRASVVTGDFQAILDNARNNTLLRALGGQESSHKLEYVTKSGKKRLASQAQIDNWTRGKR